MINLPDDSCIIGLDNFISSSWSVGLNPELGSSSSASSDIAFGWNTLKKPECDATIT